MSTSIYSGNSFVIIIFVAIIISLILFFMSKRPMAQKIVISIIPIVISLCIVKLISLANEKLDGSSKTIFENTKACNETSHDLNKNNLVANNSDFEKLCTLLENFSMFGTPFEFSSSDPSAYQTLLENLLEYCTGTTLYTYIYGKEAEYVNASDGLFKNSPKAQRDPLDKFGEFGCYGKVNADEIDWIIRNVFGVTPDRNNATIFNGNGCCAYYHNNYYYFACVGSEFEFGNHIIKNKSVTSDNVYTIEIDVNVISYDEISTYCGSCKIVCALKNIDGKRQWTFSSIEKIEKEERNTQSTTATTSKKETTTKKTTTKKVTTTKATTLQNESNSSKIFNAYKITLKGNQKRYNGKYNQYSIYDIDKDGIPELIIRDGWFESDRLFKFFSYKNGTVVSLGETGGGHSSLYGVENKSGIYLRYGQMGYETILLIETKNNKITKTEISSKQIDFENGGNYTQLDNQIEFKYTNDYSLLDNLTA